MLLSVFSVFLCLIISNEALDNGLALTPPMGWLSWLRYGCNTDCHAEPTECISQDLIEITADVMKSEGYLAAGYQYVTIDDCWLERERQNGRIQPDQKRFSSGMAKLAAYVHDKGLKFGLYEDIGPKTCQAYPGVKGHESEDAATLASWGIDYLKVDGCYDNPRDMDNEYPAFGKILNKTGRPILYSCSWPAYQEGTNITVNYSLIAENCNIWRNYGDIQNSWSSVVNIMNWFGDNQDRLAPFAGPGHWHDPDMLVIGNSGLNVDQAQVQMAVWSILAAPLMMSVKLSTIKPKFKEILLNRGVIAVNQDKLGQQGLRVWKDKKSTDRRNVEVWNRKLSEDCYAIAFVNLGNKAAKVTFTHDEIKLPLNKYIAHDLYKTDSKRSLKATENFTVSINKTGVKFYKFIPKKSK